MLGLYIRLGRFCRGLRPTIQPGMKPRNAYRLLANDEVIVPPITKRKITRSLLASVVVEVAWKWRLKYAGRYISENSRRDRVATI